MAIGGIADGLGTPIGELFNTFPHTSSSRNVGRVGVTGIRPRSLCVMGGAIMIVLVLIPKTDTLVEALPVAVLGGAGLVLFGMVAATGIRILGGVDVEVNRFNGLIAAISLGVGMIPPIAPDFEMHIAHSMHPLIDSGILLALISAIALNAIFNGSTRDAEADARTAALASDCGH